MTLRVKRVLFSCRCFFEGRRASGAPVDYEQLSTGSPTLVALLNAPELPEVIDSLIKRYQSVFL